MASSWRSSELEGSRRCRDSSARADDSNWAASAWLARASPRNLEASSRSLPTASFLAFASRHRA